jgi:hypothetical protein
MRSDVSAWHVDMRALMVSGAVALSALAWTAPARARSAADAPVAAPSAPVVASTPATLAADIESLRERAAAFWAARVAGDFTAQWELLEPRGRGQMTAVEYAAPRGAVKYLAYQVEDATVNGYFATVKVRALVHTTLPTAARRPIPPGALLVADHWIRIRGTWYRNLDQDEATGPMGAPR